MIIVSNSGFARVCIFADVPKEVSVKYAVSALRALSGTRIDQKSSTIPTTHRRTAAISSSSASSHATSVYFAIPVSDRRLRSSTAKLSKKRPISVGAVLRRLAAKKATDGSPRKRDALMDLVREGNVAEAAAKALSAASTRELESGTYSQKHTGREGDKFDADVISPTPVVIVDRRSSSLRMVEDDHELCPSGGRGVAKDDHEPCPSGDYGVAKDESEQCLSTGRSAHVLTTNDSKTPGPSHSSELNPSCVDTPPSEVQRKASKRRKLDVSPSPPNVNRIHTETATVASPNGDRPSRSSARSPSAPHGDGDRPSRSSSSVPSALHGDGDRPSQSSPRSPSAERSATFSNGEASNASEDENWVPSNLSRKRKRPSVFADQPSRSTTKATKKSRTSGHGSLGGSADSIPSGETDRIPKKGTEDVECSPNETGGSRGKRASSKSGEIPDDVKSPRAPLGTCM